MSTGQLTIERVADSRLNDGEMLIGRWCDRMLPGDLRFNIVMSIVVGGGGSAYLKSEYGDGSSGIVQLREAVGSVYYDVENVGHPSDPDDHYRIVQSTGDLQLLDIDGLIRVATRLENSPQYG